ncbi:short-chain dehydrogenase/reductase SDR [Roridomyces roridus]|uniref:Short-chain dehydrogenase/reductase SDR n=1 Tax=Roridomyces roridus TaxID=1738132 RepID=A0AAD7BLQ6_9AGAR|nr:short-chain dehydrogenase/reductase SDR [Roridomyces roridus]
MAAIRTIFVTGGNQGLGMHAVHQLASTPDVLVLMGSRKLAAAETALANFASDIHPSSSVVPVQLGTTQKNLSGLDVLVNNAAISVGPPVDIYAVNVVGTARIKDALYPLLKQGTAAILNVSSTLGSNTRFSLRPGFQSTEWPFYSSSKAAMNSLTVQWALQEDQKGSGIRVVSLCPGWNSTNLNHYNERAGNPAEGCKVIVREALAKEGKTSVFIHKDGEYPW